jgi:hypothetical protein
MLDNDDSDAPNGGKSMLLRMSKNDREMLDQICERTGLMPSDAVRAAIGLAHRQLLGDTELRGGQQIQRLVPETYYGDS